MEIWEQLKTVSKEFNSFFENIPKKNRSLLNKRSSKAYAEYIENNFTGTL